MIFSARCWYYLADWRVERFPTSLLYSSRGLWCGECLGRSGFHKPYSELDAVYWFLHHAHADNFTQQRFPICGLHTISRWWVAVSVDGFMPTSPGGPYLSCLENKDIAAIVCSDNNRELYRVVGTFVCYLWGSEFDAWTRSLSSRLMFFRYFGQTVQTNELVLR